MQIKPYILAIGILASANALGQTLENKVKEFTANKQIKQEYFKDQYILIETAIDQTSLAKEYDLKGKIFVEYFLVSSRGAKIEDKFYIPIMAKPYWYLFDGIHYKDFEIDGINGNEEQVKKDDKST